jgi:hypothetical protein
MWIAFIYTHTHTHTHTHTPHTHTPHTPKHTHTPHRHHTSHTHTHTHTPHTHTPHTHTHPTHTHTHTPHTHTTHTHTHTHTHTACHRSHFHLWGIFSLTRPCACPVSFQFIHRLPLSSSDAECISLTRSLQPSKSDPILYSWLGSSSFHQDSEAFYCMSHEIFLTGKKKK